ncbi:hypothetical protein [Symmachiella dynata]|uniref:Uncharacterized protein n=1 Tax=Symmachiella dynata TaxID=2527995 RepID=A0A517ZWE9_9PLAN|nr:hypothetical protein [Symmachiella dynata]QDU46827.1 hypothetical protein Mal52_53490 [Symmachiella dynata]
MRRDNEWGRGINQAAISPFDLTNYSTLALLRAVFLARLATTVNSAVPEVH